MERLDPLVAFSKGGIGANFLKRILEEPEEFVKPNADLSSTSLKLVRLFFNYFKRQGLHFASSNGVSTKDLLVDGLTAEQIWQVLQLENEPFVDFCESRIEKLLATDVDLTFLLAGMLKRERGSVVDELPQSDSQDESGPTELDSQDDDEGIEEAETFSVEKQDHYIDHPVRKRKSPLDDEFFSFEEMNAFANEGEDGKGLLTGGSDSEAEEIYEVLYGDGLSGVGSKDDKSNSIFGFGGEEGRFNAMEVDSHHSSNDIYYEDFFDLPKRVIEGDDGRVERGGTSDEEDSLEGNEKLSMDESKKKDAEIAAMGKLVLEEESLVIDRNLDDKEDELGLSRYSGEQRRLMEKIKKLEKEVLEPKHWALSGEIESNRRPVNSLLEVVVDHDFATKVAPQITIELTSKLEDMIRERIKQGAFDDVIQKHENVEDGDFRPRAAILEDEKNDKSLAQIYEDEFMRKIPGAEDQQNFKEEHVKCARLFDAICRQLDALSSAIYVPMKNREDPEVKPTANHKVVVMEEVTPITQSDALRYAPEEIYKPKGRVKGDSEFSREEKKGVRRENKKRALKKRAIEVVKRRREDSLGVPNTGVGGGSTMVDTLKSIVKQNQNTFVSANSDQTSYAKSSAVFQKIQDLEANKNLGKSRIWN